MRLRVKASFLIDNKSNIELSMTVQIYESNISLNQFLYALNIWNIELTKTKHPNAGVA
jgi:hypothetical protein